ncbi:MAG: hypothetical protein PHD47_01465 [Acholeplasmataceae bacterium]|nr:hypothetical protein [Acholeplasmataceae bacterium]
MKLIDMIILLLVLLLIGAIIYFKFIKKQPQKSSCHCYKAKTCSVKLDELKNIINASSDFKK